MSRLNIVLAADPELTVPPRLYGGIERIVAELCTHFVDHGHRVVLVAAVGSTAPGELVSWPSATTTKPMDVLRNASWAATQLAKWRRGYERTTVVHSFSRLLYWSPALLAGVPVLQSYQREVARKSIDRALWLARGPLAFSACSASTKRPVADSGEWHVVYNCVDFAKYACPAHAPNDAPLVFLGRLDRIKGAHTAIAVARRSGRRLVIAGNKPSDPVELAYCENEVLRHCDGKAVSYVGPVDDRQKSELLSAAACLLFPIEWEEPFGIVMVEAMACGAPVVAFRRGAVPEVVEDGVTGFVVDDLDAMVRRSEDAAKLDRLACRARAMQRFDRGVVGDEYLALYRHLLTPRVGRQGT